MLSHTDKHYTNKLATRSWPGGGRPQRPQPSPNACSTTPSHPPALPILELGEGLAGSHQGTHSSHAVPRAVIVTKTASMRQGCWQSRRCDHGSARVSRRCRPGQSVGVSISIFTHIDMYVCVCACIYIYIIYIYLFTKIYKNIYVEIESSD